MQTPFWKSALFVVRGLQKLEKLICLLSRSSVPHLHLIGNTCRDSLTQISQFDLFSKPGIMEAVFCTHGRSQFRMESASAGLASLPLPLHAGCVCSSGPASEQGWQKGGECAGRHRLSGVSCADAWGGGWREGSGGQSWSHLATATAGLTSLGAQRQLCFSSDSR